MPRPFADTDAGAVAVGLRSPLPDMDDRALLNFGGDVRLRSFEMRFCFGVVVATGTAFASFVTGVRGGALILAAELAGVGMPDFGAAGSAVRGVLKLTPLPRGSRDVSIDAMRLCPFALGNAVTVPALVAAVKDSSGGDVK